MTETAVPTTSWKDRRLYARNHVILDGRLSGGGSEARDCVLLDLSASGAMLRLSDPTPSPAEVSLSGERFGELTGRIVWQMHNVAGLRFSERPQQVARSFAASAPHLRLAS